jgi:hypothetical protein
MMNLSSSADAWSGVSMFFAALVPPSPATTKVLIGLSSWVVDLANGLVAPAAALDEDVKDAL